MSEAYKKEEVKVESQTDLAEQLQAGHRSRINGAMIQGMTAGNIQFHEVMPNDNYKASEPLKESLSAEPEEYTMRGEEPSIPESYLNYAAQLLEQMRGVYSSSWDSCSNGGSWHGGHNHFYNPCGGTDMPPSHNCPVNDCTNTCGCLNPPPQPAPCSPIQDHTCNGGTATFYDDCAYHLQKISDQLNRIEQMISEMYATNQQLFSYLIEYYNTLMIKNK